MSIFGDDGVDDLLNANLDNIAGGNDELPGGEGEQLFGDGDDDEQQDGAEAAGGGIKVEPKKTRSVRNPRPRLTVETLRGQRGLHTIEDYFKDIKFKGKGSEKQDLDEVMRRMQHWGHRMYPTYKFDDVLNNIERLGKKKPLQNHMSRYRMGMLESMKNLGDGEVNEGEEEDGDAGAAADEPFDEFDALLEEQIAISRVAPRTPTPSNLARYSGGAGNISMASTSSSSFATPSFSRGKAIMSTPYTGALADNNNYNDLATPLPPSQPTTPAPQTLTSEQIARIAENRRLAQERLAAKKLAQQQQISKPAEITQG